MLNDTYYGKTSSWGLGVVEDIRDPEQAGRVRVRIYGIHTPDKALIPTEALPWSQVVMPVSSASQSGVGTAPVGVQVGSLVYGNFLDSTYQQFLVLGTVPGKKASTDVQVVESETSVNTAPIEEFGLSASEQVYNIARAEGLSENMAAGLLAAISDNADFTNLFDRSSDRFSDYSEFALGLLSPLDDLKTQTLYVVKKISGVTFFEAAVPGGGRTQKPISSPGDAATAISQQFYGTVSEELKTYADQANAAYGSSRTEGNEGIYQASAGAEEDSEFPYLRSVEHIISYFQHGRDSRINTDNRIKGLWISATHFEGDDENNRRVPFYDAEFQKLIGRGVQTHLYILRDGSLQTGLHIEEVPNDNIVASERVTEPEPERLRDFVGTLFNLGGGETGNIDNLDFDRIFEQTLIDMLKDYRADGNPIPTLTSGTRTAEEQAIIRGQVDFAAGRNLSRHERYQAVDFREVDTRRMEEGGYLDRYDLWRRYKDNGDPYHIEERGAFRDPPEEWPFPATSTITRSIQNSVLTIDFVGMRRVGASGYTTAQWETFEALIQAYLLVFPEGNWVSSNLQYPIKGHIDSRYSDYSGVASEIEQPAALAAAPVEAQDPTVEESLPSEEPETAALPTDTSDVEAAPSGPITLPTLDPLNFPSIPSPDDTGIISIGDLLGGGSGGTATGGNADTLNNQAGSYYLDFNNFTNLPSPTLTVTGDATGTATFNSLGDATLNLTVTGGGTLNATGTPVDNQVAVWTAADTLEGDANLTWDGTNFTVTGNIVSPTLTGTPTAPTATSGTNTTQIATTAFVQQEITAASDADTLDGLDSTQFLRSDTDDTMDGRLTIEGPSSNALSVIAGTTTGVVNTGASIANFGKDGDAFIAVDSTNNGGQSGIDFYGAGYRGRVRTTPGYQVRVEGNAQYGQGHVVLGSFDDVGSNIGNVGVNNYSPTYRLDVTSLDTNDAFRVRAPSSSTMTFGPGLDITKTFDNADDAVGSINLLGTTGNYIYYTPAGVAPPTTTTRSAGTKAVWYPTLSAAAVDYATGIASGTFWNSIPSVGSHKFAWYAGTTEIATLDGSGDLAIDGDLSLLDNKTINLGTGNDFQMSFNGTDTIFNAVAGNLKIQDNGTERFSFDTTNGRLGIGIAGPSYTLDVQSSQGGTLGRFKDTDSTYDGIVIAGDTNAGWVGNGATLVGEGIYYQNNINAMRFYTNSVERMRINSAGNITIYDTQYLALGTGNDFQMSFSGNDTYFNAVAGHLYFQDNSTIVGGFVGTTFRMFDSKILSLGSDADMEIQHTGAAALVDLNTGELQWRDGANANATRMLWYPDAGFRYYDNHYLALGTSADFQMSFNGTNAVFNAVAGDLYFQDNGTNIGGFVGSTFKLNDNKYLYLGTGNDFRMFFSGVDTFFDAFVGDLYIRDNVTNRFRFDRSNGHFTAYTGYISSPNGFTSGTYGNADLDAVFDNTVVAGAGGMELGRVYSAATNGPSGVTLDNANLLLNLYSHPSAGTGPYGYQIFTVNSTSTKKGIYYRRISNGTADSWERFAKADSEDFTGTPTAPTAATGTSTTQLATTAFVQQEITAGGGSSQTTYTRSTTASPGVAYEFSATTYAGGEFVVTVHDTVAGERQIVKLLITHDGTGAYMTEYGSVETSGSPLATFSTNILSGNVRILVNNASANTTKYIIQPTLLFN